MTSPFWLVLIVTVTRGVAISEIPMASRADCEAAAAAAIAAMPPRTVETFEAFCLPGLTE